MDCHWSGGIDIIAFASLSLVSLITLMLFTIQADEPSEETTADATAETTTAAAEAKPEEQPTAETTAESSPIKEAAAPMVEAPKEEPAKEEPAEEEQPKEDTHAAAPDAAVAEEKKVRTVGVIIARDYPAFVSLTLILLITLRWYLYAPPSSNRIHPPLLPLSARSVLRMTLPLSTRRR